MVIYFADRRMNILGMASTELREGFAIGDDLKSEDTDTGVATFECTIPWDEGTRAMIEACTAAGNYILRSYKNENEFYTIVETEVDTKAQTVNIYAEDAGMDLLNETVGAYSASSAHPIAWYVEMYAEDTGFEIGINEISDLSRTLSWEGEATAAERIASVATQFDNAEISYSFEIKGLEITHKYINIHKKRGQDAGVQLRLNRDVDRIITTTSVADLATALYVTGGTPEEEEEPITLEGYEYDDGDMYVMEGTPILCSRSAMAEWSRYVWAKEPNQIEGYTGNIVKQWSYDTTSQSELCNRAITQLKKVCEPVANYEIDITTLPENVGIGDYVDIVDEKGELYLSSRILKLTTSVCNQKQTATLGEFLIQESGISQTVKELAEQFSQLAKSRTYYVWIVYADDEYGDGISLDPEGKTYMGTCTTTAGPTPDISDPTIYKWSLIQGDGGVGVETINTYYGVSESPYDVPTEWTTTPPDVLRNEYTWSYTEYIYTDGTVELTSPHIVAYYDYLEVDELDAKVANITDLLAGSAGVGDLQAIHLTADNVVIDDAVIFDLIATNAIIGDLLAGTIYTDYITIMSEDGSYTTKGATTQYCDADGNVRIQIGLDESGNFTFVLYSADGEGILIDETGIKASAISDGLIVNDMVADDAAISGSKLDIVSVTECLNEYGGITLEAAQVTIDGTTLDYKLDTITEATNRAVIDTYTEYYQSDSPTELTGGSWSGKQPEWKEDKYIWARTTTTYGDGSVITGAAVCITGNGADGKGIESIVAYYAVGDSGTEPPEEPTLEDVEYVPAPEDYHSGDSVSTNGVVFTRQPDGSIVVNGRSSSTWMNSYYIYYQSDMVLPAGRYRLSGCPSEASGTGCSLVVGYHDSQRNAHVDYSDTGDGVDFELTGEATDISLYITAPSYWVNVSNIVFRPSLIGLGTGIWSQEIPTPADDEFLWMAYLVTYTDGTKDWTGVACLTDESTRSRMTVLETELSVVQGQISAKVSSSEVYQIVNDVIDNGLDVNALAPRNYCLLSGGYKSSDDPTAIISWMYEDNWNYFDVTANDGYLRILNKNGNYNSPYFWMGLSSEVELETEYTVTAVLRGNVGYNYFYAVYMNSSSGLSYVVVIATYLYFGTEWTTVSFQWTPETMSGYVLSGIGSWGWGTAGYYMDIKSVMVEKGDTSHDWVRAPEDYAVTSDITVINDKYAQITVTLDEIASEVVDLTTISNDNYLWLVDHETRITQNEDNITIEATRAMAAEPKYGTCSTSASTAAKVVSCSDFTSLTTGVTICVYFTYKNTASSPTLNVNSTGAKTIYAYGSSIASGSDYNWEAKSYVTFVYNGSQWCMVDSASLSKIAQLQIGVTELGEELDFVSDDLKGNIVSYINASADVINFTGTLQLTITSPYFTLDEDGRMWATDGIFSGMIMAESGYIGNWTIDPNALYNGTSSMTNTTNGMYLGTNGIRNYYSGNYVNITTGCVENGNSNGDVATLYSGTIRFTHSGTLLGSHGTGYYARETTKYGMEIQAEYNCKYIGFSHKTSSSATEYTWDYLINYGLSTGSSYIGYSQKHILYEDVRITGDLYTHNIYFRNNSADTYYLGPYTHSDSPAGLYCSGAMDIKDFAVVGNTYYSGNRTYMLHVAGNAYSSGDWYSASDLQLKADVKRIEDEADTMLDVLEPVSFKYKDNELTHFGVTYQNVVKALEAAGFDADKAAIVGTASATDEEYGAVAYSELIGLLIYEVKQLKQQVKELQASA